MKFDPHMALAEVKRGDLRMAAELARSLLPHCRKTIHPDLFRDPMPRMIFQK